MALVQDVIDSARVPLNDANKIRYPDDELLDYLNDGVVEVYTLRPDLQFGSFGQALTLLAPTDNFPLPPQHAIAIKYYIVSRAETKDDENVNANRETKAFQLFQRGITQL